MLLTTGERGLEYLFYSIFFKKGKRDNPANSRLISLLSTISKLHASHLLNKFKCWLEQEKFITDEQAGFRAVRVILDHYLIIQHLFEKYTLKFCFFPYCLY